MEVEGISDAQLVQQTLEGDGNAFTALHDRYSDHVSRMPTPELATLTMRKPLSRTPFSRLTRI